ncbi:ABC transporter permease subunit [Telmatospirillum sp.]|uniref:ABC transporter permease n=1 Tax=Telmatospirillum sp. TaxID=2079197 RepID=UPI00283D5761|nr:ABC transporter permease subunit [Telmatospirillum sp.]MDR3438333.1 ABC transporter permease subunit [Telmatospirillum sp.]
MKSGLLLIPVLAVLSIFCLAPLLEVAVDSLQTEDGIGLGNYLEILTSPFYRQAFANSLSVSLWSSCLGLVIALFGAASLRRLPGRLRDAVVAATNMASNLTGVPLAFAFIILAGTNGALTLLLRQSGLFGNFDLYSRAGLILIYSYFQVPLALLLLYPAFDALDDDWQAAAALLGARVWHYWLKIGLPVLAPAILGTFILLFANAMGAYASAYALTTGNVNLVTVRIASLVAGNIVLDPDLAAALAVLLVALMVLVTTLSQRLLKKSYHAR